MRFKSTELYYRCNAYVSHVSQFWINRFFTLTLLLLLLLQDLKSVLNGHPIHCAFDGIES